MRLRGPACRHSFRESLVLLGGRAPCFRVSLAAPFKPAGLTPKACELHNRRADRRGITLFEVVLALVIFMVTLPALTSLIALGTDHAEQAKFLAQVSLECRSKLAEVTVGAEPLNSTDWVELSDPNFYWKMEAGDAEVAGLKQVNISVKYDSGGRIVQSSLSQYILDPANRGSTQDRGILMMQTPPPGMTDPGAAPAATPDAAAAPETAAPAPTTPTTPNVPSNLKSLIQNKLGGAGSGASGLPTGGIGAPSGGAIPGGGGFGGKGGGS